MNVYSSLEVETHNMFKLTSCPLLGDPISIGVSNGEILGI